MPKLKFSRNAILARMQAQRSLTFDEDCNDYFADCCNCCDDVAYPCCEASPEGLRITFEDLDNAWDGYPITGVTPNQVGASSGSDNNPHWVGEVTDTWGGDGCNGFGGQSGPSDTEILIDCVDDRYFLTLRCGIYDAWVCGVDSVILSDPGDPDHPRGYFTVEATYVSCCPFKLEFEFTADVPDSYCWSASTGNNFKITAEPFPEEWACCCPDRTDFPTTIYARIVGRDGCECMDQDFTLTGAGGTSTSWSGSHDSCDGSGADWEVTIACDSNGWTYSQSACRVGSGTDYMTLLSCDPFQATVTIEKTGLAGPYCCYGFLDIEISEVPF